MAMNQTQLKNNVYKAIEVIAEQRIDNLKLDKTIIGTIDGKVGGTSNQYRVKYNGGTLYAYAQDDSVYLPNLTVYVLVPESDFNNKKWIIGRVSNTTEDANIDTVASALNNYSIIGTNVIQENEKKGAAFENVFKLRSYDVKGLNETFQDANVLYDAQHPEISVLNINTTDLLTYARQAQAISFAADFRTSLAPEQKRSASGNYGLLFNLRCKNKNNSYADMQAKWDALEPNTKTQLADESYKRLNDYKTEIEQVLRGDSETPQALQQLLEEQFSYLTDFYSQVYAAVDSETQTLLDQYLQLISDLLELTVDSDGNPITIADIQTEYFNWFTGDSDSYSEVIRSVYLDVDNMVGNPYNYDKYAHQYIISSIDPETFIGIDSIYFFCDGFIQNNAKADAWGYDIFVKDIEINCLEELDDINDEYRLQLEFPQGTIFRTNNSSDTRDVYAKVLYQNRDDVTAFTSISWFKKDSSINSSNDVGYHAFAGLGWRKIESGAIAMANKSFAASDNKAYENYYKVIATRNLETILSKEFILYNEANKHEITIISDDGSFDFAMSEKSKNLTCLIDGEEVIDENYSYVWSKDNETLVRTEAQIKALISAAEAQYLEDGSLQALQSVSLYKTQLNNIQGISWNENKLTFPSSQMAEDGVLISCAVRRRDNELDDWYDIGYAEATLSQGNVINLKGYYIEIENGNQSFQYNEAGVSPASERYNKPIEILPLQCKFYTPNGGLVNKINYTVKWKFPTEKSLIKNSSTLIADSNGNYNIDPNAICQFIISDDYDYAAINNQIMCIVEFNGDTYYENTNFYFGKIGENGTNGTDVIAKIVPIVEETNSVINNEPLTLIIENGVAKWNTGAAVATPILRLELYRRNLKIDESEYRSVRWSMAGSIKARHMSVFTSVTNANAGVVDWDINGLADTNSRKYYTNQIIRGQASLSIGGDKLQSYNYFYPIPTIEKFSPISIGIDKNLTMRQIVYNADGRNPTYNKNQGVKLLVDNYSAIVWSAGGGTDEVNSALNIVETDDPTFVYVTPADTYSGEWTNNFIRAQVSVAGSLACTVTIPIHMYLNTYGLASLNAWDGNSIEINEDSGYILAPQIGAGEKDPITNTFTGVVMGVEKTYEDSEEQIGLLGYSNGKQSIFLNAADGSAIFGLPEEQSDKNDPYTEGRIQLVPGGTSYIGNWKIGSRSLYNVVNGDIGSKYTDTNASGHVVDIPHTLQGILMSANPAYLSIKGRQLVAADISTNANRIINAGDSLELQLDPNQPSLFTIFRHYKDSNGNWQRSATVGIDKQGRFYSNALRQESTSLAIGFIGAFGKTAAQEAYIGTSVDTGDNTIWKMFTAYNNGITSSSTLYLTGASSETNDYARPIQIMGSTLNLRTSSNDDNSRINMTTTTMLLGQKNAKISLNNTTGSITTSGAFSRSIGGANTDTITGASTISVGGALTETVTGNTSITTANSEIRDSSSQFRIYGKAQSSITPYDLVLSRNGTNNSYLSVNNHRFIIQSNSSHGSTGNDGGSIGLHALASNYGISLYTTPVSGSGTAYNAGLRVYPSRGGTSFFNLFADGTAQVNSTNNIGYSYGGATTSGVAITPAIGTHGIYIDTGLPNRTDTGIYSKKAIRAEGLFETGQNAGGIVFASSTYSETGDGVAFDVVNSTSLGNAISQLIHEIAWVYAHRNDGLGSIAKWNSIDWDDINGKPSTFEPAYHNHDVSVSHILFDPFLTISVGVGDSGDSTTITLP